MGMRTQLGLRLVFVTIGLATMVPCHAGMFGRSSGSSSSYGAGDSANAGYLGLGFFDHNAGVASTNASSGSKPFWNEVYTQVTLMGKFHAYENWSVAPVLIYGFPAKKSPESGEQTSVDSIGLRACNQVADGFDLHVGPGVLYYQIKGSGGTVTLNNGSSYAQFGLPSGTKTSTLLYWDFGMGYAYSEYRIDASLLFTSILSSTKRAMSPVVTFSTEFL